MTAEHLILAFLFLNKDLASNFRDVVNHDALLKVKCHLRELIKNSNPVLLANRVARYVGLSVVNE